MRYAIISDIHSNIEALNAVFERIDALGADKVICLGDIVGYSANPNECTRLIEDRSILAVIGNHETRACDMIAAQNFNPAAKAAIVWTRSVLTEENFAFLRDLPMTLDIDETAFAFHGRPGDVDKYIHSEDSAGEVFEEFPPSKSLGFFGHTHLPRIYSKRDGLIFDETSGTVKIEDGDSLLINPGSVGQPRDGDKRASFILYDKGTMTLTIERVKYPIKKCIKKMKEAGLPKSLADRLLVGR